MLFPLFIAFIISNDHYIYLSPDGDDNNDGSYDQPLSGKNFAIIREKIRNSPEDIDHVHIVFKEGTYLVDGWPLMSWDYDVNRVKRLTFEGEAGKKAVIYSSKKVTGWTKSVEYEHLWETEYGEEIDQLFMGDRRAYKCRMPKRWKYARFYGYEVHDDPSDSSYYLRYMFVQDDCIRMLEQMTEDELKETELVAHYWWYTDIRKIISFNKEKNTSSPKLKRKKNWSKQSVALATITFNRLSLR